MLLLDAESKNPRRVRTMNHVSLFDRIEEKGSSEWSFGVTVRDDKQPGMFRVATPQKPDTPRYVNIVPIRRYHHPTRLFPRGA